jgi:hypothetical protein
MNCLFTTHRNIDIPANHLCHGHFRRSVAARFYSFRRFFMLHFNCKFCLHTYTK